MRSIFAFFFIFTFCSLASAAESVKCSDKSGAWKVSFNLDGKLVSKIQFIFLDQMNTTYPTMNAFVNHLNGKTYYDMNFDETTYLDFSRVDGSSHLQGAFLIYQNPTGEEVAITCEAH